MSSIAFFKDLNKASVSLAGGKGASLGEMTNAGIPVPPGFVITAPVFDDFLKITDLNVELDAILDGVDHAVMHTVEGASEKIQGLIMNTPIPDTLVQEIQTAFETLGSEFVAVRSSATSEDSASAAWAGQLESYLNTTKETLIDNVKKCWASLFTPRAIFYRFEKRLHTSPISVAVVVQVMVDSEVSGIAFSVHPVTQDYDQLIIEAGLGLGEAIVSGSITPDSFVVEKNSWKLLDKNIVTQKRGLFRQGEGGNEWKDIKTDKGELPTLKDEEVTELAKLVVKIEQHYGFPVDVEWAREKGKFYIVQSRPITTLNPERKNTKPNLEDTYPDLENYVRLFQFDGFVPYVLSYEFVLAYSDCGGLTHGNEKLWLSFMKESTLKKTLKDGLDLYSNLEKYETYKSDLYSTYKKIVESTEAIKNSDTLTCQQVVDHLLLIKSYQILYQKTEFFYTDQAFEEQSKYSEIIENFRSFEKLKIDGRGYLNQIFFVPDSLFSHFLHKLADQFNISYEDLLHYSIHELPLLFEGDQVTQEILQARQQGYVIWAQGENIHSLEGQEALDFIAKSRSHDKDLKVLRGKIANKGKVTARAKVIKVSIAEYDKLSRFIDEMEKGQVLVAETTEPAIIAACKKASAIVTNQGGMMSHAAIVSREMDIPCIVGTSEASEVISDGDLIEVDANQGIIKIISR